MTLTCLAIVVQFVSAGRLNNAWMLVLRFLRCKWFTRSMVSNERLFSLKKPLLCLIRLMPNNLVYSCVSSTLALLTGVRHLRICTVSRFGVGRVPWLSPLPGSRGKVLRRMNSVGITQLGRRRSKLLCSVLTLRVTLAH